MSPIKPNTEQELGECNVLLTNELPLGGLLVPSASAAGLGQPPASGAGALSALAPLSAGAAAGSAGGSAAVLAKHSRLGLAALGALVTALELSLIHI